MCRLGCPNGYMIKAMSPDFLGIFLRIFGHPGTGIAEIIQHEEYDRSETVLNDICLLRLVKKLSYGEKVQPVCLPQQGMSMETIQSDVVGGQDGENNNCFAPVGATARRAGTCHCQQFCKMQK